MADLVENRLTGRAAPVFRNATPRHVAARLHREIRAASSLEYVFLTALVAASAMIGVRPIAQEISHQFRSIASEVAYAGQP